MRQVIIIIFSTIAWFPSFITITLYIFYILISQAAEALGAIGIESNISMLKNSLVSDPAQEVRETCELALSRIEDLKTSGGDNISSMTEKSPFMSVDPAAPASNCSSVAKLRLVLLRLTDRFFY